jgi:hypothetical protein
VEHNKIRVKIFKFVSDFTKLIKYSDAKILKNIIIVEVVLWHFHQPCYKSSPLWFLVCEGLDLLSSSYGESMVDTVVYMVQAAGV